MRQRQQEEWRGLAEGEGGQRPLKEGLWTTLWRASRRRAPFGAIAHVSSTAATRAPSLISSVIASPLASATSRAGTGARQCAVLLRWDGELVAAPRGAAGHPPLSQSLSVPFCCALVRAGALTFALRSARDGPEIPSEEVVDGGALGGHSIVDFGESGPGYTVGTARAVSELGLGPG